MRSHRLRKRPRSFGIDGALPMQGEIAQRCELLEEHRPEAGLVGLRGPDAAEQQSRRGLRLFAFRLGSVLPGRQCVFDLAQAERLEVGPVLLGEQLHRSICMAEIAQQGDCGGDIAVSGIPRSNRHGIGAVDRRVGTEERPQTISDRVRQDQPRTVGAMW